MANYYVNSEYETSSFAIKYKHVSTNNWLPNSDGTTDAILSDHGFSVLSFKGDNFLLNKIHYYKDLNLFERFNTIDFNNVMNWVQIGSESLCTTDSGINEYSWIIKINNIENRFHYSYGGCDPIFAHKMTYTFVSIFRIFQNDLVDDEKVNNAIIDPFYTSGIIVVSIFTSLYVIISFRKTNTE
ncbi:MAG: hypothetical protein HeimC2_43050 [Candidatus Heimdallarchaeota archaeon LC_2]|nr:MAG: hypothetical protein HeimC2_43050 [Candidatus Heimdallarchaeota archaeon LC_2]